MPLISTVRSVASRLARYVMPVGLASLSFVAIALARENNAINRELRAQRGQARLPHLHDAMPAVRTSSLTGDSVILAGGDARAQLLFVFDTKCHFCLETLPTWQFIAKVLHDVPRVHVYGVSLSTDSATRAYAKEHSLAFGVVHFPDRRTQTEYRAIATPITMLVDSIGSVLYARGGALTKEAVDSLLNGMRLMKLIPSGAGPAPQVKSQP